MYCFLNHLSVVLRCLPFLQLFQPEVHGGLIFTSPRAVEAVRMCLEAEERRDGGEIQYIVAPCTSSIDPLKTCVQLDVLWDLCPVFLDCKLTF